MSILPFVNQLVETGQVEVKAGFLPEDYSENELDQYLCLFEKQLQAEIPGDVPPFSVEVARWALIRVYNIIQLLIYREHGEETVKKILSVPFPFSVDETAHYSADLFFSYLKDLHGLSKALSPNDPLVESLSTLSKEWPLSSIGIDVEHEETAMKSIINSPFLLHYYTERCLVSKDFKKINSKILREKAAELLGEKFYSYSELQEMETIS